MLCRQSSVSHFADEETMAQRRLKCARVINLEPLSPVLLSILFIHFSQCFFLNMYVILVILVLAHEGKF